MRNLLYIGNKLSTKGNTVSTIDTLGKLLREEGFTVFTASKKKNKVFRLLDMIWHIIKLRNKVDYVLIDTYSTLNFYYALLCSQLCRFFKLKYIPILHGGNLPNRLNYSPKFSKAIFNYAHINIAPSKYLKFKFEELNYKNLQVIPNAISIEEYPFTKRTVSQPKLLWVRSFSEIYNPMLAIKILKKLKEKSFNASLCMVGPEKDGLLEKSKAYAKALNLEVNFTGLLSKKEWIALSKEYNVFINTTNFDNMPVSVIEAMVLGLPIISTNVGGLPFLIANDKNGILVKPNSVNAFVEAIINIVNNPEKTLSMINEARNNAENIDWELVKKQWHKVLL